MTVITTRRRFLSMLGLGAAGVAASTIIEPVERVRRLWFVPRNAPVREPVLFLDTSISSAPLLPNSGSINIDWNPSGLFDVESDRYPEPFPAPAVQPCTCSSPWCNLMHACRGCGALGPCLCKLKAVREEMRRFTELDSSTSNDLYPPERRVSVVTGQGTVTFKARGPIEAGQLVAFVDDETVEAVRPRPRWEASHVFAGVAVNDDYGVQRFRVVHDDQLIARASELIDSAVLG